MLSLIAPVLLAAAATPVTVEPVTRNCLQTRDTRGQRLSPEKGYFVQTREGWWRNTGPACPLFGPNRLLVAVRPNDNLCSGDLVNVVDNYQRINFGVCALGGWERVADTAVPKPFGH
jgi:hypothetical protein